MKKLITLNILFFLFSAQLFSQVEYIPTDSTKIITMMNGDIRIGEIISDDGREIVFITKEIGKIYINKSLIKSIAPYTREIILMDDGEIRAASPFVTRYYFTTNALPLKKGDDYAMVHLYGPEVHFSLSNRFSIGIMSTWIASPFVLAAKYSIPTKNHRVNFGLGTLLGTSGYIYSFRGYGGLHWGMMTIGDESKNITFSLGYSYNESGKKQDKHKEYFDDFGISYTVKDSYSSAPVFSIAGIASVGKKASFIFDSMIFFGTQKVTNVTSTYNETTQGYVQQYSEGVDHKTIAFFMPGMRFQTTSTKAFQVALAGVLYEKQNGTFGAFPIPQCSWFFKF